MKKLVSKIAVFVLVMTSLVACSPDPLDQTSVDVDQADMKFEYAYSQDETDLAVAINEYRASVGLNKLELIKYPAIKSEEHDLYMIQNNDVSHAGFMERSENIIKVLGVKKVGENVAYNFRSTESVLNAWLNSPSHKENIEGNYTHFGISIRIDEATGKKYYTNIFVRQ